MNWTAATAAFLCSAAAGFLAAGNRMRRCKTLRLLTLLLGRMELALSFSRVPLPDMLSALGKEAPFLSFGFLRVCAAALESGESLGGAWRAAVGSVQTLLQPWETAHLLQLGAVLGTTDLDGQKQAIASTQQVLQTSLSQAQTQQKNSVGLCRVCGLCVGCVLFIMIL